jgi:fructose-1,6-bisphosphatase II / sedoheptulose-1,7-bisphosphatase
VDRTLIQEILEVVEQAAIASAELTGLGKKDEADAAAVEAMRTRMGQIQMQGRIVIGEGERDEAPMLYIGEEVGSGTGPGVDFAVDPCEGTNLCANSQRGSMAVLAASDRGGPRAKLISASLLPRTSPSSASASVWPPASSRSW